MQEKLFNDFSPTTSKQWKQQIQYELKGADYNDTLVWESPEGIKVKPFYHRDEAEKNLHTVSEGFNITQEIYVQNIEASVKRALKTLKRGAEALKFIITDKETNLHELCSALPSKIPVYFYFDFLSAPAVKIIEEYAVKNDALYYTLTDPVGHLAKEGNWFEGENNFEVLNTLSISCKKTTVISINGCLYQNAGANITQQLAYIMAHANEYFNNIATIHTPVTIQVAVGSNYFFEIAKLRALRLLYAAVATEYGHNPKCHIIATPTRRNKTLYDYNTNMLRSTTECMSAILGGADAVINLPYDALYHKSNEFADRMARNQLLILKEESYFDKVTNPADGAYYVEELTRQLATNALTLFKQTEAAGGFIEQLKNGSIQQKIQESAAKEQELFDNGTEVLVGTNKYINKADLMKNDIELYPFMKVKPRKTLVTPIIEKRLAESTEQKRLESEEESAI